MTQSSSTICRSALLTFQLQSLTISRHVFFQSDGGEQKLVPVPLNWKCVENLIEVGNEDTGQHPGKQKRFLSYIKSLRKDNSGVSPLKEKGNCMRPTG